MEITWYGHNCFRLTERGKASVVTDPFGDGLGYPVRKLRASVVTVSLDEPEYNNVRAVRGVRRVITSPGEYEVGEVFVIGVGMVNPKARKGDVRRRVVYLFDYDDVTVLHLGALDFVPTQAQVDRLGAVGVLLVPVGGNGALNASQAAEVISLLEPTIVIPMRYKTPLTTMKLASLDRFLKEMGISKVQVQPSLKVSRVDSSEQVKVVVLDYDQGKDSG